MFVKKVAIGAYVFVPFPTLFTFFNLNWVGKLVGSASISSPAIPFEITPLMFFVIFFLVLWLLSLMPALYSFINSKQVSLEKLYYRQRILIFCVFSSLWILLAFSSSQLSFFDFAWFFGLQITGIALALRIIKFAVYELPDPWEAEYEEKPMGTESCRNGF